MGYDLSLYAWYRAAPDVDAGAVIAAMESSVPPCDPQWDWEVQRPAFYLHALGRRKNFLLCAACHRNIGPHLKWFLTAADHCARGAGTVMLHGEYPSDLDSRIWLQDRNVFYEPAPYLHGQTWGTYQTDALISADFGMDSALGPWQEPASPEVVDAVRDFTWLAGWIYVGAADAARIGACLTEIASRFPPLADSMAFQHSYLGHVLIGQDGIDVAAALLHIAHLSVAVEGYHGVLYCGPDAPERNGYTKALAIRSGKVCLLSDSSERVRNVPLPGGGAAANANTVTGSTTINVDRVQRRPT